MFFVSVTYSTFTPAYLHLDDNTSVKSTSGRRVCSLKLYFGPKTVSCGVCVWRGWGEYARTHNNAVSLWSYFSYFTCPQ